MMVANKKMRKIMDKVEKRSNRTNIEFTIQGIRELFLPNIKKVYDCLIISEKCVEELEENFTKAIKVTSDKTGYEASRNETYMNQYIVNENFTIYDIVEITNIVIDIWKNQLKVIDNSGKICFIIGCDNKNVTLRFHKVRTNESMWLGDDIEKFEDAVGYIIY